MTPVSMTGVQLMVLLPTPAPVAGTVSVAGASVMEMTVMVTGAEVTLLTPSNATAVSV